MSEAGTARDPYVGLALQIQEQAKSCFPSYYAIGKVLSLSPMRIRAEGMDLDRGDVKLARHLLPNWREELGGLSWSVTVQLPYAELNGECKVGDSSGTCTVKRPAQTLTGQTAAAAQVTHKGLQAGDEVLLLRSEDGQTYYVIDKLVEAEQ